jgi:hypothetical protein
MLEFIPFMGRRGWRCRKHQLHRVTGSLQQGTDEVGAVRGKFAFEGSVGIDVNEGDFHWHPPLLGRFIAVPHQ